MNNLLTQQKNKLKLVKIKRRERYSRFKNNFPHNTAKENITKCKIENENIKGQRKKYNRKKTMVNKYNISSWSLHHQ